MSKLVINQSGSLLSSGTSLKSSLRNDAKSQEAAVLQQATSQAIVAARSIINSGGSHATALSTAKAAAQSILVPHLAATESGASKLFLGRRKAKRQSEIIASMALLSVTNGSPEANGNVSPDNTLPNFMQQQVGSPNPPFEVQSAKYMMRSPSPLPSFTSSSKKNLTNSSAAPGSYRSKVSRDAAGISESVRELTNRVPSALPKSRPKDLAAKVPDQDPIYYSPNYRYSNDDRLLSFTNSDDDSQTGTAFDTLGTTSSSIGSTTFGTEAMLSSNDRSRQSVEKPAWAKMALMCGIGNRCGLDTTTQTNVEARGTTFENMRKQEQRQKVTDEDQRTTTKVVGLEESSTADTENMLLKLNKSSSEQKEIDPKIVTEQRHDLHSRMRDSMENVVLRAISAAPSIAASDGDMSDDLRDRVTQSRRASSMHSRRNDSLGGNGRRQQSWRNNPSGRSVVSDPMYDNDNTSSASPAKTTSSNGRKTRFRRWVKLRRQRPEME